MRQTARAGVQLGLYWACTEKCKCHRNATSTAGSDVSDPENAPERDRQSIHGHSPSCPRTMPQRHHTSKGSRRLMQCEVEVWSNNMQNTEHTRALRFLDVKIIHG